MQSSTRQRRRAIADEPLHCNMTALAHWMHTEQDESEKHFFAARMQRRRGAVCEATFVDAEPEDGPKPSLKHHQGRGMSVSQGTPEYSAFLQMQKASNTCQGLDILSMYSCDLVQLSHSMFESLGLTQHFQIPALDLLQFLMDVQQQYQDNPYHNFAHAVDVAHAVHGLLLGTTAAQSILSPIDQLALLLAALCHDAAHPGINNAFMKATWTEPRWQRIRDSISRHSAKSIDSNSFDETHVPPPAPLESFHGSVTEQLLKAHSDARGCLFGQISAEESEHLLNAVPALIMGTDMALHREYLQRATERAAALSKGGETLNAKDAQLLSELLLKVADISNVSRPFPLFWAWSGLVQGEFFAQGDAERAQGIAITPMCDRYNPANTRFAAAASFLDALALPFFRSLVAPGLLPELGAMVRATECNRKGLRTLEALQLQNRGNNHQERRFSLPSTAELSASSPMSWVDRRTLYRTDSCPILVQC